VVISDLFFTMVFTGVWGSCQRQHSVVRRIRHESCPALLIRSNSFMLVRSGNVGSFGSALFPGKGHDCGCCLRLLSSVPASLQE
jgi:hypothetical protein